MRLWAIVLLVTSCAFAQQPPAGETTAVLAALDSLFEAMAKRDVDLARKVLIPDARMDVAVQQDGKWVLRSRTNAEFIEMLGKTAGSLKERYWDPKVTVHGPLATVWAPYDFHRDGVFSHCGYDMFVFVKTAEGWKISSAAYTMEKEGCSPPPAK
jgi:hypothetical protein